MSRRLIAGSLLALALGAYAGLVVPARRDRDAAREAYARAREERERLRARVTQAERRAAATGHAPAGDAAGSVRALRLSLLRATEGLSVGGLRIAADAAGRGDVAARGRLAAEGRLAELLRVTERLAAPASGVLIERVHLAEARGEAVRLEAEVFTVRDGG